jgi:mannose-6-phosphate isomerase-like protein (cupin superfamily)
VLDGALCVRIGEQHSQITAGGAVIVPGGTAHTYWNPLPEPARYLLVMGRRTHALIQAIHAAEDRSPHAMRQLFQDHGAELLDP